MTAIPSCHCIHLLEHYTLSSTASLLTFSLSSLYRPLGVHRPCFRCKQRANKMVFHWPIIRLAGPGHRRVCTNTKSKKHIIFITNDQSIKGVFGSTGEPCLALPAQKPEQRNVFGFLAVLPWGLCKFFLAEVSKPQRLSAVGKASLVWQSEARKASLVSPQPKVLKVSHPTPQN